MDERLELQIAFLLEADRLKNILRRTYLSDASRRENSAEHSWHFALAVLTLREHFSGDLNVSRCLQMAILHDLVEIDAGDTFVYDAVGMEIKAEKEIAAAERIFGLLPGEQASHFRAIWDEFEAGISPEARFAAALDRFSALLLNLSTGGKSWREHGVTAAQVWARNGSALECVPALQSWMAARLGEAVAQGWLKAD